MSEELSTATVDDGGNASASETMQTEMAGDFFYDDGSDAVVDFNGNIQKDANGNVIRKMEDIPGKKTAADPTKPAPGQTQTTATKPTGFDSVFNKDGKFDYDGIVNTSSKLEDFGYQMQSVFKPAANQHRRYHRHLAQPWRSAKFDSCFCFLRQAPHPMRAGTHRGNIDNGRPRSRNVHHFRFQRFPQS